MTAGRILKLAALVMGAAIFYCQKCCSLAILLLSCMMWRGRKKDKMFKRKLELLVVRGMMSGRRFPISVTGSRLGRAGSCEIAINDPILSRHHCLFEYVHGDLRLTDLASANGTFVNGEELCARTTVLRHNDVITVGSNTDIIVQTARKSRRFFRRRIVSP